MKAVDLLKSKVSGHMGMLMTPDLSRLIMDVRYELGKRNIEILDLIETAFIGHQFEAFTAREALAVGDKVLQDYAG